MALAPLCDRLRERVTFYSPTATTDAIRGQAVTYTTVLCTVWAEWRGLTGREQLIAQARQTLPTYHLVTRYRADLTTQLRVRRDQDGTMCDVADVRDYDGRKVFLEFDLVAVP
jgi:SPP1 family predicted phage head-tail adaptor